MGLLSKIMWVLKTSRCLGPGCKRRVGKDNLYCGYECACYDQVFNVNTGWNNEELKRKHPKRWKRIHNNVVRKIKGKNNESSKQNVSNQRIL